MVDAGEIYHPLRWTPRGGLSAPDRSAAARSRRRHRARAGAWRGERPPRPQVSARSAASRRPGSARRRCSTSDGGHARRRAADRRRDRAAARGVRRPALRPRALGRGRSREARAACSTSFARSSETAADGGLTLRRGDAAARRRERLGRRRRRTPRRRLVAGRRRPVAGRDARRAASARRRWRASIRATRSQATLRPYQQVGVRWLHLLSTLGLGACLADDMGLGKTIQVLALLLVLQAATRERQARRACWSRRRRCSRTGRGDRALRAGACGRSSRIRRRCRPPSCRRSMRTRSRDVDLVITSYGSLAAHARGCAKIAVAPGRPRRGAGDQESRAPSRRAPSKQLDARARIALTGTPVENRLGDLWSIFDFINPGLLGSAQGVHALHQAARGAAAQSVRAAARAGAAVHPAAAEDRQDGHRRPAGQDRGQGVLRADAASRPRSTSRRSTELADELDERRRASSARGLVLAFLMRFKQICNHPSQWLGDGAWARGGQRQVRAAARDRRGDRRASRRRCWSSRSSAR